MITMAQYNDIMRRVAAGEPDPTPFGAQGDHCPWCGQDWKRLHTEECESPYNTQAAEEGKSMREHTDPVVLTTGVEQGWADALADPAQVDWDERLAGALFPYEVRWGRPVNPFESLEIRWGRNGLGRWGENRTGDALVTCEADGRRYLLMIHKAKTGWAVPGGFASPGEFPVDTAVREAREETGLTFRRRMSTITTRDARYIPDQRNSGEAWIVTVPVHIDLGGRLNLPELTAGDDAEGAMWCPAGDYGELLQVTGGRIFGGHVAMLAEFLGELNDAHARLMSEARAQYGSH